MRFELSAGYRSHYQKRFFACRNRFGQRLVLRLMGPVFFAGKEPDKRATLLCHVIAYRSPQHRRVSLEGVEDRIQRNLTFNLNLHLAVDSRQGSQMRWKLDSNHGTTWTSTDSTAGRSRTIGAQLSPASADAYTCPPVVPKYTPHESSESTAIASRSTFT